MCLSLILRWFINALILLVIPYIVQGVQVDGVYTAIILAAVLAFVNAFIRPVLLILTLPINILTLGLFTLVINGLLFWFVSTFIKGFYVTDFWSAFWAALVYTIVSILINLVTNENQPSGPVQKRRLRAKAK